MDVVALRTIVELEDLTAPPRRPKLNVVGYVNPWTPEELDAYLQARDRVFAEGYIYPPEPPERDSASATILHRILEKFGQKSYYTRHPEMIRPEMMMAEQRKMLESGRLSFYAEEFADLSDSRRVILKDDRGWSHRPYRFQGRVLNALNGRKLTIDTILVLDPDDDERWMEWVVERLQFFDIHVDPMSVRAAPFWVEFGPRVRRELQRYGSGG